MLDLRQKNKMAKKATNILIAPKRCEVPLISFLYKVLFQTPKYHITPVQQQISSSIEGFADITPLFSVVVTPSLAQREGACGCVRPEDRVSGL